MVAQPVPSLVEQFRTLSRLLRRMRARLVSGDARVPPGTIGVLTEIGRSHPDRLCHGKDLVVRCNLDASTISRAVGLLVERGLVVRGIDPVDGRAITLAVSPAGRQVLADTQRWLDDLLVGAFSSWTQAEAEAFAAQFTRFVTDLSNHLDHAPAASTAFTKAAGAHQIREAAR